MTKSSGMGAALHANVAVWPAGRLNAGNNVNVVRLMIDAPVIGSAGVCIPLIVTVRVSDENNLGSLAPMVAEAIISMPELSLVTA